MNNQWRTRDTEEDENEEDDEEELRPRDDNALIHRSDSSGGGWCSSSGLTSHRIIQVVKQNRRNLRLYSPQQRSST